jgi:hypothetical protein
MVSNKATGLASGSAASDGTAMPRAYTHGGLFVDDAAGVMQFRAARFVVR